MPTGHGGTPLQATTAMRRVLHVINGEHYSGAERVQDLLAARLPEFGYEASFALVKPGRFAAARSYQAAPVHELPMRFRLDLTPARRLERLIRQQSFVLVHSHSPRAALITSIACGRSGTPWIHHVHSPTSRDSTRWLTNQVNACVERWSLRSASAMVAVSESMGNYARSLRLRGAVYVVPNGVPELGPLSERAPPKESWNLGMVALFRPRKGLEILLESMALLKLRQVEVRLLAVGGFESEKYRRRILQFAQELGVDPAIEWTGFCADVLTPLRRMDLLVLPSLFGEGLPMVVLEAMAAGVPVVATNVEGVAEAIRDHRDGLLVPPGDPFALADAIHEFTTGKVNWASMRLDAYQRHAQAFTDRHMARSVARVYDEVLQS